MNAFWFVISGSGHPPFIIKVLKIEILSLNYCYFFCIVLMICCPKDMVTVSSTIKKQITII